MPEINDPLRETGDYLVLDDMAEALCQTLAFCRQTAAAVGKPDIYIKRMTDITEKAAECILAVCAVGSCTEVSSTAEFIFLTEYRPELFHEQSFSKSRFWPMLRELSQVRLRPVRETGKRWFVSGGMVEVNLRTVLHSLRQSCDGSTIMLFIKSLHAIAVEVGRLLIDLRWEVRGARLYLRHFLSEIREKDPLAYPKAADAVRRAGRAPDRFIAPDDLSDLFYIYCDTADFCDAEIEEKAEQLAKEIDPAAPAYADWEDADPLIDAIDRENDTVQDIVCETDDSEPDSFAALVSGNDGSA